MLTADRIKLLVAVLALAAGIGGYYYLGDKSLLLRVLVLLGALAVTVAISMQTEPGRAAWTFTKEARQELRKVVWPTQEQLVTYFAVVMVFVIVMMTLVSVLDLALGKLVFEIFAGRNTQ